MPAPARLPARRLSSAAGRVALAVIGLAVAGAAVLAVMPARIVHRPAGAADPVIRPGFPDLEAEAWYPEPLDISITTLSDTPVDVALPVLPYGLRFPEQWVERDGWSLANERLGANVAGSTLRMQGLYSSVELWILAFGSPAPVVIDVNGEAVEVDAAAQRGEPAVFTVASGRPVAAFEQRFAFRPVATGVAAGTCSDYTAYLARITIEHGTVCAGDAGGTIRVGVASTLRAAGGAAADAAFIVVAVLAALAWSGWVGYGALVLLRARRNALYDAATLLAGTSLLFAVLGLVNYVVPVRWAVLPLLVAGTALALAGTRRARPSRLVAPAPVAAGVLAVAAGAGLFALSGGQGIGLLQTDVYEYQRLTQLFWSEGALPSGSDFGSGLRLLDTSARSLFYGVANLSPPESTLAVHLVSMALAAAGLAALIGWFRRPAPAVVGGLAGAFGGVAVAGFVEGYLSRSFLTWFLIAGWSVATLGLVDTEHRRSRLLAAGAGLGVAAAIVPMYLVPVLAFGLVLLGAGPSLRDRLRPVWPLAVPMMVLGIPNLYWLRRVDVSARYAEGVSEVGRTFVLPFYDEPTIVTAMAGLEPIHANPASFLGVQSRSWLPQLSADYFSFLGDHAAWLAVVVVLVAVAVVAWRAGSAELAPVVRVIRYTWAFMLGGLAVILPFWSTQSYFILMYGWTLAPLLYATVVVRTFAAPVPARRMLVALGSLLIAVNVVSAAAEAGRWYESPVSPLDTRWRYDVGPTLADFTVWASDAEPGTYRIEVQRSDVLQTDDGRAIANQVDQILTDLGFSCDGCQYAPETNALLFDMRFATVGVASAETSRYAVVLGGRTCAGRTAFTAPYLIVCES